jgi:hypothetical protein
MSALSPSIVEKLHELRGLPALIGSEKQIKWATTIRQDTLNLQWPQEEQVKLRGIVDSTWWIANRQITSTMKYKEPAPEQLAGRPMTVPATERGKQPELGVAPAPAVQSRLGDALEFAASVSKHPKKAEAAILALLSRLYRAPMKEQLQGKAMIAVIDAQFEDGRDLNAIKKLLSSSERTGS